MVSVVPPDDPVTVRLADLDDPLDAQAIVDLTDAYARDPMGGGQGLSDDVEASLVAAMRAHGGIEVLLAISQDDGPVGLLTSIRSFSAFNAAPVLNVHDLAVLEAHRGQGVGARLLRSAEVLARQQGCCRMSLEVLDENPAKRLYEREGFSAKSEYWVKSLGEDRIA